MTVTGHWFFGISENGYLNIFSSSDISLRFPDYQQILGKIGQHLGVWSETMNRGPEKKFWFQNHDLWSQEVILFLGRHSRGRGRLRHPLTRKQPKGGGNGDRGGAEGSEGFACLMPSADATTTRRSSSAATLRRLQGFSSV